jgi:polyribonucleotide nucleotidyltransferase
MDFKVAGTSAGITAIQLDVKVHGITHQILREALDRARHARTEILAVMNGAIEKPRPNISSRAPEIISLQIKPEQIGLVIGSGGKTINKIKETSGVTEISVTDAGDVYITGPHGNAANAAAIIKGMTREYHVGETVAATITRLSPFGAFAKLDDFHEGLIHISEVAPFRLETLDGVLTVGDTHTVMVIKVEAGKIGLSLKRVDPEFVTRRSGDTHAV